MKDLIEWLRKIRPSVLEANSRSGKQQAFWCWRRETDLRGRGFSQGQVEGDPELLERLLALEERAAETVRRMRLEPARSTVLEERIRSIRKELDDLAGFCRGT